MQSSRTIALVVCCVLALSSAGAAQKRLTARDESVSRRTLRFAAGATNRVLDVRLFSGSIHVTGTGGSEVEIEIRKRVRARSDADLAAARDVAPEFIDNAARIGVVVRDDDRRICGEPWDGQRDSWRPRDYEVAFDLAIRVPRDVRLGLCGINDGDIRVEQTAADFEISHVNGAITLQDVSGSGSVETVNGELRASFAAAPRAATLLKTLNGDVETTFPADLAADFRLKTFNGELFTDFDVVALARTPAPVARRNGTVVYQSNVHTDVRVGRGGPEITIETFNGDVRVRRATR
jgi:hypothetical protein